MLLHEKQQSSAVAGDQRRESERAPLTDSDGLAQALPQDEACNRQEQRSAETCRRRLLGTHCGSRRHHPPKDIAQLTLRRVQRELRRRGMRGSHYSPTEPRRRCFRCTVSFLAKDVPSTASLRRPRCCEAEDATSISGTRSGAVFWLPLSPGDPDAASLSFPGAPRLLFGPK